MAKITISFSILKVLLIILFLNLGLHDVISQAQKADYPITPVPFTEVHIDDHFWQPRLETNRRVTIPYTFKKSEETGRISNFAKAGGLEEGEFEGIFFNDSDVFKIIEGASYSLQVHPDPELKNYVDGVIAKIAAAQEEDGYLYTNRTINPEKAADKGGEQRWTNLRIFHELYNVGHLYEAAVAHYQATGERSLIDVAIKNADLVDNVFGPGKNMGVPGHEEIEIGLVKLYRATGEEKYLNLARFFVDQRGNEQGHELYGEYSQDHKPLKEQEKAVGHSVRAGYYYAGATDIAAITDSKEYDEALNNIWQDIIYTKIYLTGGIGAEPKHEGFGPEYELPNATAYTETCAAIALMLWNHRLFLLKGDVKYMDLFERTLYNGFLSGVSLEGDTFFYPNPLEADGVKKFNHGVCGRSPWFRTSCCPVNVVRVMPSLPGYIYATRGKDVFVNLFIGNNAKFDVNGRHLDLKMTTNYPWDGKVEISIENSDAVPAGFNIRIPGWVRNEVMPGDLYRYVDDEKLMSHVKVNGKQEKISTSNGYISLQERDWKKGDIIEVTFDMAVRKVVANKKVKADKGKIALERGPLVYCAEEVDNPDGVLNLKIPVKDAYNYVFDASLLNGLGSIIGEAEINAQSTTFKAIPYYAWANRKVGEMAVWLNKK